MRPSTDELLGRARELAPRFAARALDTERNRAPLDESLADLVDAELLSVLTPRAYGGHQLPVRTAAAITATLSAACPSTGWVYAFYAGACWRSMMFEARTQRELFADKPYLLNAGQAAPLASVKRVEGGFVLNGQTAWSSGAVHAEWILFMGVAQGGDAPPTPMVFILPRAETTLIDTWQVAGMRGTGSVDVRVDEAFVPAHRAVPFVPVLEGRSPGQALHGSMYQKPFLPFLMCEVVPVLVGALRGAASAMVERTLGRRGTLNGVRFAERQLPQARVGRGLAAADAAEDLLAAYLARFENSGPEAGELPARAAMKLRGAFITDFCRNALNDLARGFGGDGFREASPLQRYFRDVNMLAVHAFLDIDTAAESAGRLALGLTPDDPVL